MEKLRLSLWDFFTFFMTGVFASVLLLAYLLLRTTVSFSSIEDTLSKVSGSTTVVGFAIIATLGGMVIEPFANFFDRFLNRRFKRYSDRCRYALDANDAAVKARLSIEIEATERLVVAEPYFYAKDYVEQHQLAPNLITFLSRYGFYRNAALIAFVVGLAITVTSDSICEAIAYGIGTVLTFISFKYRGDQFYSYMAPLAYRTALIHRLRAERLPKGAMDAAEGSDGD